MTYIYDVLVNFSGQLYEFYEWNKKDKIIHLKKISIIKINNEFMNDLFTHNLQIDSSYLDFFKNKCEKYDGTNLEYAAIFSDGEKVLAIEFDKDGNVINRSRLLIEDEEEVNMYLIKCNLSVFKYYKFEPYNARMYLTRKEINIKNKLLSNLNNCYSNNYYDKISYLYFELFGRKGSNLICMYDRLVDSILTNFNVKHIKLYDLLLLESGKVI